MKVTQTPIAIGSLGTIPKGFIKGLKDLKIRGDYKDNCIIKIDYNTE